MQHRDAEGAETAAEKIEPGIARRPRELIMFRSAIATI